MDCHVGHMSYAAFGYADDLLLLSPSIHGLEMLVKISESFASEYGVTFNATKTECIWARISKCVPAHIFLRKNLNYLNYITFFIYWKPRHCIIWI